MFLFNKALICVCNIIATTILTEFCIISSASAYSLDWGRSSLDPADADYISWDASAGELNNIYEFDPQYSIDNPGEELYVKLTVSTDPADDGGNPADVYAINTQGFGNTPGIYLGSQPQAGAGLFTDELFVFTNRPSPTPDTITLTIEFFEDAAGTIATNVEDFNTTFADLDAGNNSRRQETITFTGENDTGTIQITPTFTKTAASLVTFPDANTVQGHTAAVEDDKGNVNVLFDGEVHKVTVDFQSTLDGNSIRHMYMSDLGITPTIIPVTPVPFEFSPTLGIVMSLGLLGGNYLRKKYL